MTTRRKSRRTFLKTSAAATASLWTGIVTAADNSSANERLNIAMIGVGGKGESNCLGLLNQNIVALCDVDDERAARIYGTLPRTPRFQDFRKMLDEQKDIDAVVVSTPDHLHAAASVQAMRMGKHVYCEKPLARTIYESRIMRQVAAEKKVATQMGNHGHANNGLRRAVELVRAGAIGKVRQFHAWTNRPSWPQGLDRPTESMTPPSTLDWELWLGPAPHRPYHSAYAPFKWRGWWDFGTGAMGDMACHIADLGFWALDLGYPTHAVAEVSDRHPESGPKSSIIRYKFPARGDQPPVEFTWYDSGNKPDPALALQTELPANGSFLVGDDGVLYVPDTYGAKFELLPADKFKDFKEPEATIPRTRSHYQEWVEACKGGPAAMSNFDYAGFLTEVVLLGNIAIRLGQPLEWDGPAMKAVNQPDADRYIHPEYRSGWSLT